MQWSATARFVKWPFKGTFTTAAAAAAGDADETGSFTNKRRTKHACLPTITSLEQILTRDNDRFFIWLWTTCAENMWTMFWQAQQRFIKAALRSHKNTKRQVWRKVGTDAAGLWNWAQDGDIMWIMALKSTVEQSVCWSLTWDRWVCLTTRVLTGVTTWTTSTGADTLLTQLTLLYCTLMVRLLTVAWKQPLKPQSPSTYWNWSFNKTPCPVKDQCVSSFLSFVSNITDIKSSSPVFPSSPQRANRPVWVCVLLDWNKTSGKRLMITYTVDRGIMGNMHLHFVARILDEKIQTTVKA